jgi:hypothetical protein
MAVGSEKWGSASIGAAAVALFLAGAIGILTGASLLLPGAPWPQLWRLNPAALRSFAAHRNGLGLLLLAIGILSAVTAAGLLRRRRWAWWACMALFTVNGLGDLICLAMTDNGLRYGAGALIAAAFAGILALPQARRQFTRQAPGAAAADFPGLE